MAMQMQQQQQGQAQMMQQQAQQMQAPVPMQAPPANAADNIAKLTDLKGLLDAGVLTQEEFDVQKKQILAGGGDPVATPVMQPAMQPAMQPVQPMMPIQPVQAPIPGAMPRPPHVPANAIGPVPDKWHGQTTGIIRLILFCMGPGCWICCCAIAAGEGLDNRMVWIGPSGEKYLYPTGGPAPRSMRG